MKFGKEKKGECNESDCASCGGGMPQGMPRMSNEEARKKIVELEAKRCKPVDCPYLETCDQKMLPLLGHMICLDEELGGKQGQGYMIHMSGHHIWEQCKKFAEMKRLAEGVLPKDLKKTPFKEPEA